MTGEETISLHVVDLCRITGDHWITAYMHLMPHSLGLCETSCSIRLIWRTVGRHRCLASGWTMMKKWNWILKWNEHSLFAIIGILIQNQRNETPFNSLMLSFCLFPQSSTKSTTHQSQLWRSFSGSGIYGANKKSKYLLNNQFCFCERRSMSKITIEV